MHLVKRNACRCVLTPFCRGAEGILMCMVFCISWKAPAACVSIKVMQCSMQCVHVQEWLAHHHLHLCPALYAVSSLSCIPADVSVRYAPLCVHVQEWPAHHHLLHLCPALHAVSSLSCIPPDVSIPVLCTLLLTPSTVI